MKDKRYTINHCGVKLVPKSQWPEAAEKLARYEDTGLTPEQIYEMDRLYSEKCAEVGNLKTRIANTKGDLLATIDMAINATNTKDIYSLGMRNGFRYVRSVITGEKPEYESVDEQAVKPDWEDAINIILGSGKEYKAILSILNRLEIRDDKMAYTMKVLKAEKNAIWRICIGNAPNKDKIKDILSLMDGDESVL